MTRETSAEAYRLAKEQGLLTKLKLKVYWALCNKGQMTANEIRIYLISKNMASSNSNTGVVGTRLSELKRAKAVVEKETRICKVSGFKAIVWGITGDLPIKPIKRESRTIRKTLLVKEMDKMYAAMLKNGHEDYLNWISKLKTDIKNL